nr:transmembrane protein 131-like [Oncorhynchus nerka]
MFSSGDAYLPTGQQGGTRTFWEIPPFETKGVMRASFSSGDADNHTAFIRIKTNEDQFIILPVEVISATGIYSSTEMLDFGTLRSQDRPEQLNLHLLNSGRKDVWIASIRTTPSNEATINFKAITLKAGESRYTKVASISFDASKAESPFSGKITVKVKEINSSKPEVPYQAEVLQGYLGFDHTATLFHIRDSPIDPVNRSIFKAMFSILTIPAKAAIAVGKLNSYPEHILLPPSFPGKIVHQSFTIQSSFTQRARLRHIRSLTEDIRFYYKRLRSNKNGLEPRRKQV